MESEFIEPSLRGRTKLALLYVAAVTMPLAIDYCWPPFMKFVKELPLCEQLPWLRALALGFVALGIAVSVRLAWEGQAVLRSRQWPLPGTPVFRRTKVKRGLSVLVRAYTLLAFAGVVFVGLAYAIFKGWPTALSVFSASPVCNGA